VVEHAPDGDFHLADADADRVIRVTEGDQLWQTERLYNLGMQHLPDSCEAVAFMDADILFVDPHWADKGMALLDKYHAVHLFNQRVCLEKNEDFATHIQQARTHISPDVIQKHGMYDGQACGANDTCLAHAISGMDMVDRCCRVQFMSDAMRAHYSRWAQGLQADIGDRHTELVGEICSLWHGPMWRRRYSSRYWVLRNEPYDPELDLQLTREGTWQWGRPNPALHAYVKNYVSERQDRFFLWSMFEHWNEKRVLKKVRQERIRINRELKRLQRHNEHAKQS
jgi:hypothetical protein